MKFSYFVVILNIFFIFFSDEEYSFDVTAHEIKELLLQLVSGSSIEKVTIAGINYSLCHHQVQQNEKCISRLFIFKGKDDSNTGLYFYTNSKTVLIATTNSFQSKSCLDDLARDMIEKGF